MHPDWHRALCAPRARFILYTPAPATTLRSPFHAQTHARVAGGAMCALRNCVARYVHRRLAVRKTRIQARHPPRTFATNTVPLRSPLQNTHVRPLRARARARARAHDRRPSTTGEKRTQAKPGALHTSTRPGFVLPNHQHAPVADDPHSHDARTSTSTYLTTSLDGQGRPLAAHPCTYN